MSGNSNTAHVRQQYKNRKKKKYNHLNKSILVYVYYVCIEVVFFVRKIHNMKIIYIEVKLIQAFEENAYSGRGHV